MDSTRRTFLGAAAGAGASLLLGGTSCASLGAGSAERRREGKRILILGGTGFLGPKTVEAALARGHSVTIFNRGKTEKRIPFAFEGIEHLYGNRDPNLPADDARGPDGQLLRPDSSPRGLEQLEGRSFDVVIDNSGYYPRHVRASAELLARGCGRYVYISSISAYADSSKPDGDEDSALAVLDDPTVETMGEGFANYGGLKALCEQAAQAAFPGRAAVVRPGYIVGPGDPTDRFSYWPIRIARGGEVAAPGSPDDPLQWIDVRDLAAWLVTLVEDSTAGAFTAVGPHPPARFGDVLAACIEQSGSGATLRFVDAAFLQQRAESGEETPFPIWAPPTGDTAGFHRWRNERALRAGLELRPVADSIRAILDWHPGTALRAGPTSEAEQALLAAWAVSGRSRA